MRSAKGCIHEVRKGELYQVSVEAPRNPRTGKRQRPFKTVRGTRKDAEVQLAKMIVELGERPPDDMTLGVFAESLYFPDCEKRLRPDTVYHYRSDFQRYWGFLGNRLLSEITPALVNRGLSLIENANTRKRAYKTLNQILNRAVKWDMLRSNPCSHVDIPKTRRYRPEVLTAEEAQAYISHFRGSDIEAAVLIAIGCGLRRSEIVALDWEDVEDGVAVVDDAVTSVAGKAHRDDTKTEFGVRRVNIPKSIMSRLDELRSTGALVKDTDGNRMNPDNLSKRYKAIRDTLPEGVKRISLKNLRHTSLTLALEGGADLLAVSRRAGHSSIAITAAYYLRPSDSIDKAAASALDSLL